MSDEWLERRSDARRNHERVLEAAIEVFTEVGINATIPQIAARAGVGKATVYRSYPTKADLINAIAQHGTAWLHAEVELAAAIEDPMQALESLMITIMGRLAEDRMMVELFATLEAYGMGPESINPECRNTSSDLLDDLIHRAVATGALHSDVTHLDLQVIMGGCARSLISLDISDPALWRRYAALSLNALRT